jgi:hypothetical protein
MIGFTDITGLAGIALAASVLLAPLGGRVTRSAPALVAGGVFVLMLLPLFGLPIAGYVRGATGDLSITSVLVLACAIAARCGWLKSSIASAHTGRLRSALLLPVFAACVLYPMALGATPVDAYAWGYGEPWFLAALLGIAIGGLVLRLPLVAPAIALAVLAWAIGWSESGNLWDYLIDPMMCVYALGKAIALTARARLIRSH